MKVFIVYVHPEPRSLNGALKDLALRTLQNQGHQIQVSDLYAMQFNALATRADFLALQCEDVLHYMAEQLHAAETLAFTQDIREELEKLRWAEVVIFQFPLWWFSMPALLKGWIDRVFAMGVVYGGKFGIYDQGGLRGKKALLSVTSGTRATMYSPTGLNGDIERILYPIQHGILYFVGMQVLPPFVAYNVIHDAQAREQALRDYEQRLLALEATEPIFYHPLSHYDEHRQLRPEFARAEYELHVFAGKEASNDETDKEI
jgi:NAD(P)H dehydrogenase (quinone)